MFRKMWCFAENPRQTQLDEQSLIKIMVILYKCLISDQKYVLVGGSQK